ncbi:MAG: c-type cytochrome [Deltaproteobacteria bacterium]
MRTLARCLVAICLGAACGRPSQNGSGDAGADAGPTFDAPTAIAAEPQRQGDPDAGSWELLNADYVTCGVPYAMYEQYFGKAQPSELVPGRDGDNATLPYYLTATTTDSGVEVVAPNCLSCHAAELPGGGGLYVGLGDTSRDYTQDQSAELELAAGLATDPGEKAELQKFADRMSIIGPYTTPKTIGVNPADNLGAILFTHHDQKTLAWSDAPLLPVPQTEVIPVRVPPWWRTGKKHALYYNASGRGDHARLMMTATTLCTDSVAQATAIDSYFPNIEAFVDSVKPPPYPYPIDQGLAAQGAQIFSQSCAICHGSQGAGGSYPNLAIPLALVGTDPTLAQGEQFAGPYVDWYNGSFYGEIASLDPLAGYVAPPLDGVWAIAPYLHNGSVPTLGALLDSSLRPTYWSRSFKAADYDPTAVGWKFTVEAQGGGTAVYDTTQPGYSNAGHTFGDPLSTTDRQALIEYLKTL